MADNKKITALADDELESVSGGTTRETHEIINELTHKGILPHTKRFDSDLMGSMIAVMEERGIKVICSDDSPNMYFDRKTNQQLDHYEVIGRIHKMR